MSGDSIPVPLIVAALTGAGSLLTLATGFWVSGHRERMNRGRDVFSKAFIAVLAYEEFPFVVRRRRANAPEEERIRISTELRSVQEEVAYYTAWLSTESQHVSDAYQMLIKITREVAGREIHTAWNTQPVGSDDEMDMPDLGLDALMPFKQAYLAEVKFHLSLWPRRLRRVGH